MGVDDDFTEFVESRWPALFRLAYLLTASSTAAEDLLQSTLEKAYVKWPRIRSTDYPEAYVRRMLANNLMSSRRRAWVGERPTEHLPEKDDGSPEMPSLDRALLWPLVCALPERQRAVIVLRYYEDLTEREIAEALGCAPGTVKSQTSSAMKALRRALAATGIGEAVGEA